MKLLLIMSLVLLGSSAISCTRASAAGDGSVDSLRSDIGQMILVGFRGLKLKADSELAGYLRNETVGGVILFDLDVPTWSRPRNVESPRQVTELCDSLRKFGGPDLLIAVDQEGGRIARLSTRYGYPETLSQGRLGELDDPQETLENARVMAKTLADAGINLNFAPVVDLNTNPDCPVIGKLERSFSADPAVVVRHALQVVQAMREKDILCTLKHFPGHGSASQDSHLGFTDVSESWSEEELEPYRAILGIPHPPAVMTAHIYNRHLDPHYPATLSKRIIQGILRDSLGYDGVVVSDDMHMKAIAATYSTEEAIELAINAGVDILIFSNNAPDGYDPAVPADVHRCIEGLVKSGKISPKRIRQSAARVRAWKKGLSR